MSDVTLEAPELREYLLALADEIQAAVEQTFGIRLEREPVLVGRD